MGVCFLSPFGFKRGMDAGLIALVPDHFISFYLERLLSPRMKANPRQMYRYDR